MAAESDFEYGRGMRNAVNASKRPPDYTGKKAMAKIDQAEAWARLEAEAEGTRGRLIEAGRRKGERGRGGVSAEVVREFAGALGERLSAGAQVGGSRALNGRVSKPTPTPKQTRMHVQASARSGGGKGKRSAPSTKTRKRASRTGTSLPSPPDSTPSASQLQESSVQMDLASSRSSSPLSEVPEDFEPADPSADSNPHNGVGPSTKEDLSTAPEDDSMSVAQDATMDDEPARAELATGAPADPEIEVANTGSPADSAEDNITVQRKRGSEVDDVKGAAEVSEVSPAVDEPVLPGAELAIDTLPAPTEPILDPSRVEEGVSSSAQAIDQTPPESNQTGAAKTTEVRQTRRRVAPKRFGASEPTVPAENAPVLLTSDVVLESEDDADYQESPKKRRKTSTASAKTLRTPVRKAQTPRKATPAAKLTSTGQKKTARRRKSVEGTPDTKIVTLKISPSALAAELPSTPPAPEPEPAQQTTPKRARKQPLKATPKTPMPPLLPPTPDSIAVQPIQADIAVDPEKLSLSRMLTARQPLGSKPPPQGQPQVWAESRQALCETLPYFKRPQGGCYQNDSHVYGFLFDSVGHCREYLDEDIIICRAGGSMEQDPSGGMVQKKDQSMKEAQVVAILNDIAHQNPLIVICGNRNGGAKCEMPHQYSVLGWYKPVAVWEEKTAGKGKKVWTTIKYRLERLNQVGEAVPWHAPAGSDLAALKSSASPVHRQQCEDCGKEFDQVYLQGWMCLNSACDSFWQLNGSSAPAGTAGLDYNPDFLLSRAPSWADESMPPAPVRPPIPDVGNVLGDNLAYINTRGICCPKCGRCNSRRLFDRWVCENPSCDFELRPQHRPVMPTHLHTPWDVAPTLVRNKVEPGVHLKVEHKYGYKVCTYTFDGIDGCFIHAAATKAIVDAPSGPNDLMANLQSEDLGLERRVFAVTKMSGGKKAEDAKGVPAGALPSPPQDQPSADPAPEETDAPKEKRTFEEGDLMTAFSMNYGMPYKFVASGASRSFENSPQAVNETRYRLNWAARTLLNKPKEALDFNEELIFTYLEGQKIEYHDDGEDGLGPEIASLSLGGRAKMHMRMKAKHHVGCSKTGILTEERPVPGSIDGPSMYAARLAAWNELQPLRTADPAAYQRRRKEIPRELGIFEKRGKKADDLVTVTLSHGDVMVMDGYEIQRYLEHKVVPEGYLRFALTCRTVLEGHLGEGERPGYKVERDEGVYDGCKGWE